MLFLESAGEVVTLMKITEMPLRAMEGRRQRMMRGG